jgi:hypothetical protein
MVVGTEQRELIRRAVDLRARERVKAGRRERGLCAGCAGPLDQRTPGCQHAGSAARFASALAEPLRKILLGR